MREDEKENSSNEIFYQEAKWWLLFVFNLIRTLVTSAYLSAREGGLENAPKVELSYWSLNEIYHTERWQGKRLPAYSRICKSRGAEVDSVRQAAAYLVLWEIRM